MTGLPEDKRERLLELLSSEAELLAKLREQTELQSHFLSKGDIDRLSAQHSKRQEIIDRFDGLHQETDVLMQSYVSLPDKDAEIEARRTAVVRALEEQLKRDKEISEAVKSVAATLSGEIRKLSDSRRGLDGYKYIDPGHSGLFDKKM